MCHYRDHSGILICQIFPRTIIRMFTGDSDLIDIAEHGMRLILLFFPLVGFQMVSSSFSSRSGWPESDFPVFNPPIDLFIALSSYPAALLGYRRRLGKYSGSGFYRFDYNRVDVGLAIEEIQDRGIE